MGTAMPCKCTKSRQQLVVIPNGFSHFNVYNVYIININTYTVSHDTFSYVLNSLRNSKSVKINMYFIKVYVSIFLLCVR